MLTPVAWAFTRISVLGVWRYLGNVDEVKSPRFIFVLNLKDLKITNNLITMKRYLLFIVSLFVFTFSVMAEPVDPDKALQIAKQFVPQPSKARKAQKKVDAAETSTIVYTHKMPKSNRAAFYIVNVDGGSFVLVSADDMAHQILGYSFDKSFPIAEDGTVQLPPHIKAFFDDLAAQMEAAIEKEPNRSVDDDWKQSPAKARRRAPSNLPESVDPLLTTTWDQGQYYNALCPADAGGPDGHVWAGCVATAMAQIIRYWSYPVHGRGTHGYESTYGTLSVNYEESNYDYSNMPNALSSESTEAQVNTVAKLLYDCGVAANMEYAASESSSFEVDARAALINFFRFSPDMSYVEKDFFTNAEWSQLLQENIAANHPVIYSGFGTGGHTFVLDGYKEDDYFHFNFGWGGFADGWFLTSSVNPGSSNYSSSQTAIVGIVPDDSGNVILGQTSGTSTFIVDEPLEFYHLMGNNAYDGGNYLNPCNNTVTFISVNNENQLVADIIEFEDQRVDIYDGANTSIQMRSLIGGNENDLSPVVSTQNGITLTYSGNMYDAGFKLMLSQNSNCRMVSNIATAVESTTVHLTWTENGTATQWQVEYGEKGFSHGEGILETVDNNTITIEDLQKFTEYDFYIRSVGANSQYGPWNKVTIMVLAPYWQDIVTSQPEGYFDDGNGNITVSTAEGLAWWAKQVHLEPGSPGGTLPPLGRSSFNLYINADIDLSGNLWKPVNLNYLFEDIWQSVKNIDGQGYVIENMTVIEPIRNGYDFAGFISYFYGDTIQNVTFKTPVVYSNAAESGILSGYVIASRIENCGVINGSMTTKSDRAGGLIGELDGCKGLNCGEQEIINCFVKGEITSSSGICYGIVGGLVGLARYTTIKNCYSATHITNIAGWHDGLCAYNIGVNVSNCYKISQEENQDIDAESLMSNIGLIEDNGTTLIEPVSYDGVFFNDLLAALNKGVEEANIGLRLWVEDTKNINGGYPILGDKQIITCPNIVNLTATNIIENGENLLRLSWNPQEGIHKWTIKLYEKESTNPSISYIDVDSNVFNLDGLTLGTTYKIYVRAELENTSHSGWGDGIEHLFELPYWTDIVTSEPDGYKEDEQGNVYISNAQGLAWLASCVNGLNGQSPNNFEGKTIVIISDVDLSGYRWMPIGINRNLKFCGYVSGCNRTIRNAHVNENSDFVGLFGFVFLGKFSNIVLQDTYVRGIKEVGGLCGSYASGYGWFDGYVYDDIIIDNCHSKNGSIIGLKYVGGILGRTQDVSGIKIVNCSTSGNIYCWEGVGGIVGFWSTGSEAKLYGGIGNIYNCYSSANIFDYNGSHYYAGGIAAYSDGDVQNCYSFGEINTQRNFTGQLLGVLHAGTASYLYSPANNINQIGDLYLESTSSESSHFSIVQDEIVLNPSVSINGQSYTNLLSALNAWVDANNSEGQYRHWVADTENVNSGYPVFAPAYTLTYKVDGEIYKTRMLEAGAVLTAETDPTKEGYTFGGWSGLPETMPDHDVEVTALFYLYGDVNTDSKVNVVDVVDIARFVVETPSVNFREKLADLNKDMSVNIADAVVLVNHIAGDQNLARAMSPRRSYDYDLCQLQLQSTQEKALSLGLDGDADFTAFQFEVELPQGVDISAIRINGQRKDGHQLIYNKVAEKRYRVAGLSLSNAVFKGSEGELLNIALDGAEPDDITIGDIHFVTTNGTDIRFDDLQSSGTVTGVTDIRHHGKEKIFDLQGRRLSKVQRGVNIVNGQKVVVK